MAVAKVFTGLARLPSAESEPLGATNTARLASPSMPSQLVSVNASSGTSGPDCGMHVEASLDALPASGAALGVPGRLEGAPNTGGTGSPPSLVARSVVGAGPPHPTPLAARLA